MTDRPSHDGPAATTRSTERVEAAPSSSAAEAAGISSDHDVEFVTFGGRVLTADEVMAIVEGRAELPP